MCDSNLVLIYDILVDVRVIGWLGRCFFILVRMIILLELDYFIKYIECI